ncbi:MAG: hypothetical protein ABI370_11860, partial [Gammaproteobacteria bacterium]
MLNHRDTSPSVTHEISTGEEKNSIPKKETADEKGHLFGLTYNIGTLTSQVKILGMSVLNYQVNKEILRDNKLRAAEFVKFITELPAAEKLASLDNTTATFYDFTTLNTFEETVAGVKDEFTTDKRVIKSEEKSSQSTDLTRSDSAEMPATAKTRTVTFLPRVRPNYICLQEVFDAEVGKILVEGLQSIYKYHTDVNPGKIIGSGLLTLSEFPILAEKFIPFSNKTNMLGEESLLASKGHLVTDIQYRNTSFYFTSINTHTHAGGAILKNLSVKWGGTTSERRGMQMGEISETIERRIKTAEVSSSSRKSVVSADKSKSSHQFLMVTLCGDMNASMSESRTMFGISTEQSGNGFKRGGFKYSGQVKLMTTVQTTPPSNLALVRTENLTGQKGPKKRDPNKFAAVVSFNKKSNGKHLIFSGSVLEESKLKESRAKGDPKYPIQDAATLLTKDKCLDLFVVNQPVPKIGAQSTETTSNIIHVGLKDKDGNTIHISDHQGLFAKVEFTLPKSTALTETQENVYK